MITLEDGFLFEVDGLIQSHAPELLYLEIWTYGCSDIYPLLYDNQDDRQD